MKHKYLLFLASALVFAASCSGKKDTLYIVTTGDVHGAYFNESYVEEGSTRTSLMSVKHFVDSLRSEVGRRNVILLDAGDALQGDNASYYYNYVDTEPVHIFARMASYMGYDAAIMGNHDVETGHPVYDKVARELKARGVPYLAGNYIKQDGTSYFPSYTIVRRSGRKVLVMGFGNANIKAWLSEELWSGMAFESLVPFVQNAVDEAAAAEKPDAVIVVVHSGTGEGDGEVLESQGMDLFNSLKGVDVLVTSHDHRPYSDVKDNFAIVNCGSKAGNVGFVTLSDDAQGRHLTSSVVRLDKNAVDEDMVEKFRPDFEAVKAFTLEEVGTIEKTMRTRDAYAGMSDYINLIHTVQIAVPEARLSLAAPLTFDGSIKEGTLVFNDMFTVYPYENQLFVVNLTGEEIVRCLEYSYDNWIQTPGAHVLKIACRPDPRTGSERWSFVNRSYNFDSMAGLVYDVDVTKPFGSRIAVKSLADGTAFDPVAVYPVAMTSYRANGGGDILPLGAGIKDVEAEGRVVAKYPEIRTLIYDYIKENKSVTEELVSDRSVIGAWKFVPESVAGPLLQADLKLLFPRD